MKDTRCESINVVVVMLCLSGSCVVGVQPSSKPVAADIKIFTAIPPSCLPRCSS